MLELQSAEEVAAALTTVQEVTDICRSIDALTGNVQKCVQVIKKASNRMTGLDGLLTTYRQYSALVYSSTIEVTSLDTFHSLSRWQSYRLDRIQGVIHSNWTVQMNVAHETKSLSPTSEEHGRFQS